MSDGSLPAAGPGPAGSESLNRHIGRASAWLMAAQLLGYACRFLRVKIMAMFFGLTAVFEAYSAAFNVPLTVTSILNAAVLSALVPMLIEARHRGGERAGAALWTQYGLVSAGAVLAVTLAIIAAAGPIVRLLTDAQRHDQALAAHLLRIQMAYLALYFVQQYIIIIFHSHRRFIFPTLLGSPALLVNTLVMWLLLVGPLHSSPPQKQIEALVWGLYANTVFMLVFLIGAGWRLGILRPAWQRAEGLGRALRHSAVLTLSNALSPVTLLTIDIILAAPIERGIGTITYAYNLFMTPVAVGVYSLGYVLLPHLSTQIVEKRWEDLSRTLSLSIRVLLYVTVPLAAGMAVVSEDFVRLFEGGEFQPRDTALVGATLRVFAWGLILAGLLNVITKVLNAMQRVRAILLVSAAAFALKIAVILLLRQPLGAPGFAWGTVAYFALSVAVLGWWMTRLLPIRLDPQIWRTALLCGLGGTGMALAVLGARPLLAGAGAGRVALLLGEVAVGAAVWVVYSVALRLPEFHKIRQLLTGRRAAA